MKPLHKVGTAILSEPEAGLQVQFHVAGAGDGIGAVGFDLAETDLAVQGDRVFHDRFYGIEAHAPVTDVASLRDDAIGKHAAESLAAELRTEVQALHLAGVGRQSVERDASGKLALVFGEQKPAVGRGVVAGQVPKLCIEVLEAKTKAQRLRVFEKQFAGLRDLGGSFGLRERKA